jgi:elongation factor Ts
MTVTAQMVKELRETTGAGMMDAKKALTEVGGDMEAAIDWLRTKGLAKAAKKADRVAAEGLIGVAVTTGKGVAVEINSETDFVAKNEDFQALVRDVANVALTTGASVEVVKAAHLNGKTVDTVIQEAIARIGENMTFRRLHVLEGDTVVSYVHNAATAGMGKIGVLVALKGASSSRCTSPRPRHCRCRKPPSTRRWWSVSLLSRPPRHWKKTPLRPSLSPSR